jgi:Protein of unknown function (DUF3592)
MERSGDKPQTYRASVPNLIMACVMFLVFAGAAGGGAWLIIQSYLSPAEHVRDRGLGWFCFAVFGAMFAGATGMLVVNLRRYEVTENSLTELSPLGVRTIFWSDIIAVDLGSGKPDADASLTLRGGRKRNIAFSQLANLAPGLREALMLHTEAIREQERKQFDRSRGAVPFVPSSVSILGIVLVGTLMGFTLYVAHASPASDVGPLFFFMNLFWLALMLLFVWTLTRRFVWSDDGIGTTSLFGKKWMQWSEITSTFERDVQNKSGQTEVLTVTAGKKKVLLTDRMPGYPAVKEMIMERVGSSPRAAGEADRRKASETEDKQIVAVVAVCIVLLLAIVGWLGALGLQKQHTFNTVSTQGVSAVATVTGKECSCGDHLVRDVVYSFQAGGIPYIGEHSLPKGVAPLRVGDRVEVIYLPGNPSINRLQMELETGGSWGKLVFLFVITALYIGLIVQVLSKRRQTRKLQQAAERAE